MSALDSQSLLERLPNELLERIFLLTSARDILQFSLVNHAFYGLIRASPSIQYEIDLFGAGLQCNPRSKTSLADCRVALEAYCSRWKTLDTAEKWERALDVPNTRDAIAINGTYGILWSDSAKFFTLGSASRGIPGREWDVPLEDFEATGFIFCPQANVMAIVEEVAWTWIVYLRTLSDGEPHPAARIKTLSYTFAPGNAGLVEVMTKSITSSRLVILRGDSRTDPAQIIVWDWTTGQILLELENEFYRSAMFVDEYWLAFVIASSGPAVAPRLVLFNTEQMPTGHPALTQTTFHFNPNQPSYAIHLYLDKCGHKPSREEALLASFYQDPSQRVLAVDFVEWDCIFVMKIEVLLKLARERGGTDVEWQQWNGHVIGVQPGSGEFVWVSGPRLFYAWWVNDAGWMNVHDFSLREFARCSETVIDSKDGKPLYVMWPTASQYRLPWNNHKVRFSCGSHDSIAFLKNPENGEDPLAGKMYMWNF